MSGPTPLSQVQLSRIMTMVYGGPGVGKTIFACGSQNLRTFHIDVDRGVVSAKAWKGGEGFPATRHELVTTWPTPTQQDFTTALDWFIANQQHFDLVVIDTATELQRIVVDELARKAKLVVPSQREWGIALLTLEWITRLLRNLQKHVIVVAHEINFHDKELDRRMAMPAFQGQYGTQYAKHFDLILRYQIFDEQIRSGNQVSYRSHRFLNCQRDQVCETKDRFSCLAKYEPPLLDAILGKAMASFGETNASS